VELAETAVARGDKAGEGVNTEPSVSSALEHLAAGSQGVITKRIDLALLEGQELLSRTLQRAALNGAGTLLAVGAWFAGAACLVQFVAPDATLAVRLALFALLNGGGAVALVTLAMRRGRLRILKRRNAGIADTTA